jgi:glycosyltransferase involved in cell wall biosynthesis
MNYNFIGNTNYNTFIDQISDSKGVVFFPHWVETFNRFLVEARALECKVMTNKKVGCVEDGWMNYKGNDLIDQMEIMKDKIFTIFDNLINNKENTFFKLEMPRVSIMTTFIDAEKYIDRFLETVTSQTIFEDVDLIIYDAGSTGKEQQVIGEYCQKYSNIQYIRDETRIGSSDAFNKMMEMSENDFIGMISIDDRPTPDYAEKLRKYLMFSEVDLVYGDCVNVYDPNEEINEQFYTDNNLYEHSLNDFSRENMIKSLPGPMPMFRKSMIQRSGGFNTSLKHANDWELWLRCVRDGSVFYKVDCRVGQYYFNPDGVTTSQNTFHSKIKEEAAIFNEFKDVIGDDNYNKYKNYFSQGL